MKQGYKNTNIVVGILMVVLVFLCSFNVAYAYFTAQATVEGNLTFYDLNVRWAYISGGQVTKQSNDATLAVNPSGLAVMRGENFAFKTTSGTAITSVGLTLKDSNSSPAYVRCKLHAYLQNSDDTTDYGQYVILTTTGFVKFSDQFYYPLSPTKSTGTTSLATGAQISTSAPAAITGGQLKIVFEFEAVQADYTKAAVKALWSNNSVTGSYNSASITLTNFISNEMDTI